MKVQSTLLGIAKVLFGVFLVVFAYGLYQYPKAPIRKVEGRYVDKSDGIHSREEFESFRSWERTLFVTFGASILSALAAR